jgi:5-methylcytosine-specific restriction protein A
MARSVAEWIGAKPDTPIPPRVRLRVFERDNGRCQCGCRSVIRPGMKWETDHTIALVNGGENRESNLRTLLAAHHREKTRVDVREKSVIRRKRAKSLGIKPNTGKKIQSRGFEKVEPQRSASRPITRPLHQAAE